MLPTAAAMLSGSIYCGFFFLMEEALEGEPAPVGLNINHVQKMQNHVQFNNPAFTIQLSFFPFLLFFKKN